MNTNEHESTRMNTKPKAQPAALASAKPPAQPGTARQRGESPKSKVQSQQPGVGIQHPGASLQKPGAALPAFAQEEDAVRARKEIARRINEFIQNTRSGT